MLNRLVINNNYDILFFDLVNLIKNSSKDTLINDLKNTLKNYKENYNNVYTELIDYYKKYNFWGTINEQCNHYKNLENRVNVLKDHLDDFIWLYNKLEDYTSKYTLYCILNNWLTINTTEMRTCKSNYKQYFDLDIFQANTNDVFIDCGAYTGDTLADYINTYGRHYARYYIYEINKDSLNKVNEMITKYNIENVIVKNYGVGDDNSFLLHDDNASTSKISVVGTEEVRIIRLDEDLDYIPTFIKMDVEGYEEKALTGAQNIIAHYKPKLTISAYHGYDDLWKLPELINKINPNYKFYLRNYGGNLIPTEFILYCK